MRSIEDDEVRGDATFRAELAPDIELSNAEGDGPMWMRKFLPLETPVPIDGGTTIDVELQSHDGIEWRWRGVVHGDPPVTFDQMTALGTPPCIKR